MKLISAIKELKGSPVEIPDCSRNNLPQFFKEMKYSVGAEIGVYKAEFTEKFCEVGLHMFAIDPWAAFGGQGRSQNKQERQDFLYGHAQRVLAPYPNKTFIRKPSMEALNDFEDGSLDFVYIDGDHSFRYIAEDLCEWSKKVRKGGVVSGHDYFETYPKAKNLVCHVKPVVNTYAKVFGIENWYVLGSSTPGPGEHRDHFRSWMWIKD
jgi:hypothetical protein